MAYVFDVAGGESESGEKQRLSDVFFACRCVAFDLRVGFDGGDDVVDGVLFLARFGWGLDGGGGFDEGGEPVGECAFDE